MMMSRRFVFEPSACRHVCRGSWLAVFAVARCRNHYVAIHPFTPSEAYPFYVCPFDLYTGPPATAPSTLWSNTPTMIRTERCRLSECYDVEIDLDAPKMSL